MIASQKIVDGERSAGVWGVLSLEGGVTHTLTYTIKQLLEFLSFTFPFRCVGLGFSGLSL